MTGAHWLILAPTAVAAVLCLWWTRRHPRVRSWADEPGDPTHEQIDQALDVVAEVDREGDNHA